jgi:hypothetical protein
VTLVPTIIVVAFFLVLKDVTYSGVGFVGMNLFVLNENVSKSVSVLVPRI